MLWVMPDLLHFTAAAEQPQDNAAEVAGLVAPYQRDFTRYGTTYRFTSLRTAEPLQTVKLLVEHDPERPVGHAIDAWQAEEGLRMQFQLAPVQRSADALAELRHALRDGFSVGVELDQELEPAADGSQPVELTGTVREVSLVSVPQFNEARAAVQTTAQPNVIVFSTEEQQHQNGEPTMTSPRLPSPADAAASFSISDAPEWAELSQRVADLEQGPGSSHPLAQYASLAAAIQASATAEERIKFQLTDNYLDGVQNEGLNKPGWLQTVFGIIQRSRVAVESFGGAVALPDSGMTVHWPYVDPVNNNPAGLVGEQTSQKTDIYSSTVDISQGSAPVQTFAGGNDNALQLIERSSPSFLEAYGRIMLNAYGVITDQAFARAVFAAGTPLETPAIPPTSPAQLKSWLFQASDLVEEATGAPATFCLVSPDVFTALGQMENLEAPEYGTVNTPGTASAATLRINVSGLPVRKCRGLMAGSMLASNEEAASFGEDGPSFIDQLNVSMLGRDTAIYGYGASMVHIPAGVIVGAVAPPAATGRKG